MASNTFELSALFSTELIRERSNHIFNLALSGKTHFQVNLEKLSAAAQYVADLITQNYPDLNVPYHSRWRHFEIGDEFQLNQYRALTQSLAPLEKARLGFDLIVPSVLIDAGAGPHWRYQSNNSVAPGRSEGLALASLDMFLAGGFGAGKAGLPQTEADSLLAITEADFARYFNISNANPMAAVSGRVQLLVDLGKTLAEQPNYFPNKRPGDLVDFLLGNFKKPLSALTVLATVLHAFGPIWPGRIAIEETNLGDTWAYPQLGEGIAGLVPFHKLSQWLTYSLVETLQDAGIAVVDVEKLTGLAEYRNGGFLLDFGLLELRDENDSRQAWPPASEIIIEWRALTIVLLDLLAEKIAAILGLRSVDFPLAKVLQGGTWQAGRLLARNLRPDLSPPLQIISDGTVF
ncbi:DUF1688 family protein [Halioxenophilus sp. WMMB6]|uniref:DUF1688 family protein n=1 Tax=Halioxenophilus sp. WMMB6 TaxID=3073815 RepID=UPI00295F089A|nr:DUF1688 family protein [Halioxenophilus sp. WMMB6]